MRLPFLLVVAQKTNTLNIDWSPGVGVKLWSVALREHLVKISGHSGCRLISSNVVNVEKGRKIANSAQEFYGKEERKMAEGGETAFIYI